MNTVFTVKSAVIAFYWWNTESLGIVLCSTWQFYYLVQHIECAFDWDVALYKFSHIIILPEVFNALQVSKFIHNAYFKLFYIIWVLKSLHDMNTTVLHNTKTNRFTLSGRGYLFHSKATGEMSFYVNDWSWSDSLAYSEPGLTDKDYSHTFWYIL